MHDAGLEVGFEIGAGWTIPKELGDFGGDL